jgi:GntR family transcriptional regulator / MocR family aminotransferase
MMKLDIPLNKDNDLLLYRQIYAEIRHQIVTGQLAAGVRLPPTRRLAAQLNVARVTVGQAYTQLQAEGLVISRVGAGTFVADVVQQLGGEGETAVFTPRFSTWGERIRTLAPAQPRQSNGRGMDARGMIDFGFGRSFPHIFPYDVWRRLLARYLSTDDAMLSRYGSVAGFNPLRQALATYLTRWRGVACRPEQVVIVSGAQQALDLLARLLLPPGSEVVVETPGYTDAYALFQIHGAQLTALPVDEAGLPVELLPDESRARLLFITPSNQFPRGGTMPLARRLALLNWARQRNALIVEDDYDGELRYDGQPLGALQGLDRDGRVVYLGTFSKVLFPALRLGYVVLPESLVRPFLQAKTLLDRGAPTLMQAAVADFMMEGHFERHLRHLRQTYGARRAVLEEALTEKLGDSVRWTAVPAGLHIMLYLRPRLDEVEVIRRAAAAGVIVYPGSAYFVERPSPPAILLGFSGLSEADIGEGVKRLAVTLT